MKINTFEELERLIKLVGEHRIECLKVDGIEVHKSAQAHVIQQVTEQVDQAGTGSEERATSIWNDPLLFPKGGDA